MDEFEGIYREYFRRVYAFLRRLCSDASLCEEMTQETFVQAYMSFHRYDGSCEIFTWLAAIAKNTYFKYLRKKKVDTVDIELYVSCEDPDESTRPEETLMRKLERQRVVEAIGRLNKNQKDVVVLRIFAELKFSEIASVLGISENSAKVIFHRAKDKLREELING